MDFKNFIDILATPKNIGTNKWVLNNFSDLKSSNDYLHIIRLRYDNRWLRTYWDGKLKEVEKDFNFYVSTPIKNKIFTQPSITAVNTNVLDLNFTTQPSVDGFKNNSSTADFYNNYERKYKDNLGEGSAKSRLTTNNLSGAYFSTINNLDLESLFSEYGNIRKYFSKNVKNTVKTLSDLEAPTNLWTLNRLNNVGSVYPNYAESLLSGNLFIGSKESDGEFNTNLVAIRDPSWSGLDRYFLSNSRRNIQDLSKLTKFIEEGVFFKKFQTF
jgi:hypothetical protein